MHLTFDHPLPRLPSLANLSLPSLSLYVTYRLVDTAGLTRIRTDKSLLLATREKRKMKIERSIGKDVRVTQRSGRSTYSSVELPGLALVDPEADPSQASHQVRERERVTGRAHGTMIQHSSSYSSQGLFFYHLISFTLPLLYFCSTLV